MAQKRNFKRRTTYEKIYFLAIVLILCLYEFLSGLFLITKDYTGEKAKVSFTLKNDDPDTVIVYVPKYGIHLRVPKKEWSVQDEFILQKDSAILEETLACILLFIVSGIGLFSVILIGESEIKLFK